jgi:hypothetical protein
MTKRVNRRIFLRGLGGACVAAPFLGSLTDRKAKAQSAAAPRRLIVMWTHFGCITTRFFPAKSHGTLTADDLQQTTLAPLVPYIGKVLMPRGIRAMNEWTSALVRGQGNDTFEQAAGTYFTCQPLTPNSNDPFSFDNSTKFNARPLGPSLDHVIAQQLSTDGTPLLMRVGNQSDTPASQISYSASVTPYSGLGSPSAIFSDLTGLFQDATALSPDSYRVARGATVLDVIRDDLDTLERFDMSQSDKNKLEAWKALLHDTTPLVTPSTCSSSDATVLDLSSDTVGMVGSTPLGSDVLMTKVTDTLDGADIYSNLAVLAALCNANPVIFLKYPGSYVFKGLGITQESTSLSFRLPSAAMQGTCVPNALAELLSIDHYYASKFAHLVGTLAEIDEGDGALLDNTATIWFQEVSDGCARNLNNLPIVQVGSCGGYFKTGWAVNVEDGSPNLSTGNSEADCSDGGTNMVNALTQETGTDPKVANAPINKYFCNLMNALGVKAGADGFPAKGGTAEVTKFGMYDKTEDFIGGGTNPPTIHDPGEFTALKAGS